MQAWKVSTTQRYGPLSQSNHPCNPWHTAQITHGLHQIRSRPDDGRRLRPGIPRHDSSVEGIGSSHRQQAPVTVVTSTRLEHGPVVDSCYGPAAAGILAMSQNPAQPLFDQLHQIDLVPMKQSR